MDTYNFEIKTYNFINKMTINDFPKKIPIIILWSPYFDSPTEISKEKTDIINKMNEEGKLILITYIGGLLTGMLIMWLEKEKTKTKTK